MAQRRLLNFTKKTSRDLDFMARPELLSYPFDRVVSRVKHKTEFFHFFSGSESIEELERLPKSSLSWKECCLERAHALLQLNREKYFISYSGGIDSTSILVSLLQTWPSEALRRVTIYLSHQSVEENPTFFDKYLSNFNLCSSMSDISDALVRTQGLLVTGELGDQLFGSDILAAACERLGDKVLSANYADASIEVLNILTRKLGEGRGRAIFEHFLPIVEECPFPIRTTHDFFWWFNFTQKWHHVKYRFVETGTWNLRARYGSHVLHFYDTPNFQRWSLDNHDLKIRDSWDSYKYTAKDFIYEFTGDKAHHNLKKVQSLLRTYSLTDKRIAVDEHYQIVPGYRELKDYVRYEV